MSPTHKAYIQDSGGASVTIHDVPTPSPTAGQVLITVLATPIPTYTSGVLSGKMFPLVHPLTPGIAAIGRIAAAGSDSTTLTKDQLVYCNPCIRARDDRSGGTSILHGWFSGVSAESTKLMAGPWRHGSWAQKMLVPTENVVPLDEARLVRELGYSVPQLAWINEYLVGYGGYLAAGAAFRPGATVIVAPATGHFGGCAVKLGLALGAGKVIAVGRNAAALQKLEQLDPSPQGKRITSVTLSGDVDKDTSAIRTATPSARGAELYIDFSPPTATSATHLASCVGALRHGGVAVLMGGVTRDLGSVNYAQLMINNVTIKGNFMYGLEAPEMLVRLVESGMLGLKDGLETKVFGFGDLEKGIEFAGAHVGSEDLTVLTPVVE